jgi:hypothetical protein
VQSSQSPCCENCESADVRLIHVTGWLSRYYRCRSCGHIAVVSPEDEVFAGDARLSKPRMEPRQTSSWTRPAPTRPVYSTSPDTDTAHTSGRSRIASVPLLAVLANRNAGNS